MGSKTRKVSHQTSKDSSLPENNLKMAEPSLTTTSKRSPLFTFSSDSEVECKSLSRPSQEKPSPLMSSPPIQLTTSKPRSKTRKVSHQTSKDSSLPESNLKMEELLPTTTFKKSPLFTLSSDSEVETAERNIPDDFLGS